MNIVGLDLSLRATGIADDRGPRVIKVGLEEHANHVQRTARLHRLVVAVDHVCKRADLVILEGYAFGMKQQSTHSFSLGELGGGVKLCLHQRLIPWLPISPSEMKRYATGKGNATKEQVLAAAIRSGADVDNNNAADAWWLRHMAIAHYRHIESNQVRKQVLDAITWPELEWKEEAVG